MGTLVGDSTTDEVTRTVEADWPTVRCDIREHSFFAELRERLGRDHPAFSALDRVQASCETYYAASAIAWERLRTHVLEASGLFTAKGCDLLTDVLLMDAFHHETTGSGIEFHRKAEVTTTDGRGNEVGTAWLLRLGSASIQRSSSQEIEDVRGRWPALLRGARGAEVIDRMAEAWATTLRSLRTFRAAIPARQSLREALMSSGRSEVER